MNPLLLGVLQSIPSAVVLGAVMVVGFQWLRADIKRIEVKVDRLADDHNNLARELSEVKGYLRRELPESDRQPVPTA